MAGFPLAHGGQLTPHHHIERLGEGISGVRLDCDSGRHGMSTILDQVLLAFSNEGVDVQSRGRPGTAHQDAVVVTDDDAGPIAVFDETRGHNSNDASVPILAPDDVDVLELGAFGELLNRGRRDLFVVRPPDVVQPVQVHGQLGGALLVACGQQINGLCGPGHPSGRVDARTDAGNDVPHGQVVRRAMDNLEQRANARPRVSGDRLCLLYTSPSPRD